MNLLPVSRRACAVGVLALSALLGCEIREQPDVILARADSILVAAERRFAEDVAIAGSSMDTMPLGGGRRQPRLSPLADSIGRRLVFMTYGQRSHVAAGRAGRLLLDLGRLDHRVETPEERSAYLQAVAALAPVQVGERFRISAMWGEEDARISGFDVWNGRVVAVLEGSARMDSAVRGRAEAVAAATRADSAAAPVPSECDRSGARVRMARVRSVADSLTAAVRADTLALHPVQRRTARVGSSFVHGCFARATTLVVASMVVGDHDHVRQSVVLIDRSGQVVPVSLVGSRFRSHEALHALDADGDGVDDVAVRGRSRRVGGTVILRLDPELLRLEALTSGFAWETM